MANQNLTNPVKVSPERGKERKKDIGGGTTGGYNRLNCARWSPTYLIHVWVKKVASNNGTIDGKIKPLLALQTKPTGTYPPLPYP